MITTVELINKCLNMFFIERSPEEIVKLLSKDFQCYGIDDSSDIENISQVVEMLESKCYTDIMEYSLNILEEKQIADECAIVNFTLSNTDSSIKYRVIGKCLLNILIK